MIFYHNIFMLSIGILIFRQKTGFIFAVFYIVFFEFSVFFLNFGFDIAKTLSFRYNIILSNYFGERN